MKTQRPATQAQAADDARKLDRTRARFLLARAQLAANRTEARGRRADARRG
jgi:hypothetical protein